MRNHIVLLALAGLPVAACRNATAPERPIAAPLSLRATVARTTVTSGDTVTVRLTAHNVGTRPVVIDNPYGCRLGLRLQGPDGESHQTVVFSGSQGGCTAPGPVTLAPGDSVVQTGRWEASVLIGGDVLTGAYPGTWRLHTIVSYRNATVSGTGDVPAVVTVVPR